MDSATAREYADTIGDRKVRNRVLRFAQFLDDHDVEPMHIEATVYSDKHLYAGSCDIMALIDGVPTICDMGVTSGG